jgi:hypothetical protein
VSYLKALIFTVGLSGQAIATPHITFVFKHDVDPSEKNSRVTLAITAESVFTISGGYKAYSASSGKLLPGADHRDTITSWWPLRPHPYGTYSFTFTCRNGRNERTYTQEIKINPAGPQIFNVRAACKLENSIARPISIKFEGPF